MWNLYNVQGTGKLKFTFNASDFYLCKIFVLEMIVTIYIEYIIFSATFKLFAHNQYYLSGKSIVEDKSSILAMAMTDII